MQTTIAQSPAHKNSNGLAQKISTIATNIKCAVQTISQGRKLPVAHMVDIFHELLHPITQLAPKFLELAHKIEDSNTGQLLKVTRNIMKQHGNDIG